jgi:hypothetical protein
VAAEGADASWAVADAGVGLAASADLMAAMAFRRISVIASWSARAEAEVKEKTWVSGAAAPAGETTTFKATLAVAAGVCWRSIMFSCGLYVTEQDALTCDFPYGNRQQGRRRGRFRRSPE